MSITATELKQNLGKYLRIAASEKVYITQYGRIIAVLSDPQDDKIQELEEMKAKFSSFSDEEIDKDRWERLSKKCGL